MIKAFENKCQQIIQSSRLSELELPSVSVIGEFIGLSSGGRSGGTSAGDVGSGSGVAGSYPLNIVHSGAFSGGGSLDGSARTRGLL